MPRSLQNSFAAYHLNLLAPWSLVLVFTLECASATEPWLLLIEGEHSAAHRKYAHNVVGEFAAADRLDNDSKERLRRIGEGLASPWYFNLASGTDDPTVSGWMYVATPGTLSERFRFWHSKEAEHYDRLTTILMSERDGNVDILESKYERVVRTSQKLIRKDKVVSSWADLYVGQREGIITLGSASAEPILMQRVAAIVAENKSRASFIRFEPSAIPDSQKASLMSEINRLAGTHMQQRDQESDLQHSLRSVKGDLILEACNSALYDVEFMEGYTAWPEDPETEKFQFGLTLVAKEETGLAEIIAGLAGRRPSIIPQPIDNGIGTCVLSLRCPDASRSLIESAGRELCEAWPALSPIVAGARETGELLCAVQLSVTGDSEYTLSGLCGSPDSVIESAGLDGTGPDSSVLTSGNDRNFAYGPFSANFRGIGFDAIRVQGNQSEQRMEFTVTRDAASQPRLIKLNFDSLRGGSDLCTIQLDLDPENLGQEEQESNTAHALLKIEEMVHQAILEYRIGKKLRSKGIMKIRSSGFFPLAPSIVPGGDWSLDLKIVARGRSIRIVGTMGRDLHALILARTLMTESLLLDLGFIQRLLVRN